MKATQRKVMPKTHKGYIVPFLLILVLLGFAGFVIFTGQGVELPVVATEDTQKPATSTRPAAVVTEEPDDVATTTSRTPSATSTASTTLDISAELE